MTTAYNHLCTAFTRLSRFEHLSAIAGWDMQTMMPAKILLAQAMAEQCIAASDSDRPTDR